jgi:hypothetical protein
MTVSRCAAESTGKPVTTAVYSSRCFILFQASDVRRSALVLETIRNDKKDLYSCASRVLAQRETIGNDRNDFPESSYTRGYKRNFQENLFDRFDRFQNAASHRLASRFFASPYGKRLETITSKLQR